VSFQVVTAFMLGRALKGRGVAWLLFFDEGQPRVLTIRYPASVSGGLWSTKLEMRAKALLVWLSVD